VVVVGASLQARMDGGPAAAGSGGPVAEARFHGAWARAGARVWKVTRRLVLPVYVEEALHKRALWGAPGSSRMGGKAKRSKSCVCVWGGKALWSIGAGGDLTQPATVGAAAEGGRQWAGGSG
jgi:hypothetical protein